MRKLTTEKRAQILTALVEGNSIAPTCRMFGVNKITVLRSWPTPVRSLRTITT